MGVRSVMNVLRDIIDLRSSLGGTWIGSWGCVLLKGVGVMGDVMYEEWNSDYLMSHIFEGADAV